VLQAMETEGCAWFFAHCLTVTVAVLNENVQVLDTGHAFSLT